MKLTWMGHSCFLFEDNRGVKLLTDPFDGTVGYPPVDQLVDIATISHNHYDHNAIDSLPGSFVVVRETGSKTVKGITIQGFHTFHDDHDGAQRGDNIVFRIQMDGLNIVHCGDLGHLPNAKTLESLLPVDILLTPVGGTYTIDGREAAKLAQLLSPMAVVPMHYKTKAIKFPITDETNFIKAYNRPVFKVGHTVTLMPDTLEQYTGVMIMSYK